jgi:diguanylate cyclase (GGDEF)-like protein
LTGLLNRSGFVEELSADGGTSVAVVLIDLGRFKEINDTLGHHAGDGLLTAVAARLRDAVRIDALARLGSSPLDVEQTVPR